MNPIRENCPCGARAEEHCSDVGVFVRDEAFHCSDVGVFVRDEAFHPQGDTMYKTEEPARQDLHVITCHYQLPTGEFNFRVVGWCLASEATEIVNSLKATSDKAYHEDPRGMFDEYYRWLDLDEPPRYDHERVKRLGSPHGREDAGAGGRATNPFSKESLCPNADASFERYFEDLGYRVSWEGRMETGERWYEIFDDGRLALQVSMPPPPVAELITDLPHLIEKRNGVGPSNYWIASGKNTNALRELLRRATSQVATKESR